MQRRERVNLHNRKRPTGEAGRFWGYYREERSAVAPESRRIDDEAAAIAAERIRSGAADHDEDGAEALASLGINLPEG